MSCTRSLPGDCLHLIAGYYYGDTRLWERIWKANRDHRPQSPPCSPWGRPPGDPERRRADRAVCRLRGRVTTAGWRRPPGAVGDRRRPATAARDSRRPPRKRGRDVTPSTREPAGRVETARTRAAPRVRGRARPALRHGASPRRGGAVPFQARLRLPAPRGPAAGDRGADRRASARGDRHQVLLGVTGSGKTFTMANVIAAVERPALVIAHNKTLAAQLYSEFKQFFPENAVEYFVSYYDYYQPEAYIPQTDTYIEKDSSINDDIDKLRHSATRSLLERRDVRHRGLRLLHLRPGLARGLLRHAPAPGGGRTHRPRDAMLRKLVEIQYERNDLDLHRGTFRVRGDVVEIFPAYEDDGRSASSCSATRSKRSSQFDPLTRREAASGCTGSPIYPANHYVTPQDTPGAGRRRHPRRSWRSAWPELQAAEQAARGAAPATSAPCSTWR
ncbi:MAG: DEAD/DEAH box helicase family protein [Desulfobacterales bacterium]|nr:DEAD/DEAH box helicase family protein [Desulfobacterales bacterium]